jgi:4-azaleucine resistance transporter AzlC
MVHTSQETNPTYADGARRVAPLALATVIDGLTFGVLATSAGFGALPALVMSATTFAGSAQFAAASLLGAGSGVLAAVTTAVLLNTRAILMGISVAPALRGGRLWRFLTAQLVTDETWAIGQVERGRWDRRLIVGAGLTMYAGWVGGTTLGLAGAGLIEDPRRFGLDVAFCAVFLAVLTLQLKTRRAWIAALSGAAVALALVPVAPQGVPIVAAGGVALAGGLRRV